MRQMKTPRLRLLGAVCAAVAAVPSPAMSLRLRVRADSAGAWAADDVFTDPYRR